MKFRVNMIVEGVKIVKQSIQNKQNGYGILGYQFKNKK